MLSAGDTQPPLEQANTDLREKVSSLEAAQIDLANKTEELRSLTVTNLSLEKQVQTLQTRLSETQDPTPHFSAERERLEREKHEEIDLVRGEAEKFETE